MSLKRDCVGGLLNTTHIAFFKGNKGNLLILKEHGEWTLSSILNPAPPEGTSSLSLKSVAFPWWQRHESSLLPYTGARPHSAHSSQSLGFQGKIYKARFSLGYVNGICDSLIYKKKSKGKCDKHSTPLFPTFPCSTLKTAVRHSTRGRNLWYMTEREGEEVGVKLLEEVCRR